MPQKKEMITVNIRIHTDRIEAQLDKEALLSDYKKDCSFRKFENKPVLTIREFILVRSISHYLSMKISKQTGNYLEFV